MLEKPIARGCFWLGTLGVAASFVWRALNALSVGPTEVKGLDESSVYKGAFLILMVAIASACYGLLKSQKQ